MWSRSRPAAVAVGAAAVTEAAARTVFTVLTSTLYPTVSLLRR